MSTAEKKLCGVYINPETKLTTMDVPHKVVDCGGAIYFIARHPEGDYAIHRWSTRDQNGYGAMEVTFLLDDGSLRTVKGPYSTQGPFDFGTAERMAQMTGIADIAAKAYRLAVGRNLWSYAPGPREIVFEEPQFVLGDIRPRVKAEWLGLELRIESRGGYRFAKVADFVEEPTS